MKQSFFPSEMKISKLPHYLLKCSHKIIAFLISPKILLVLLPLLLISGMVLYLTSLGRGSFQQGVMVLSAKVASQENSLLLQGSPRSNAKIYLDDQILKMDFQFNREQIAQAQALSQKLEVSDGWVNGLSLKLDEPTAQSLSVFLPLSTTVAFAQDKIILGPDRATTSIVVPQIESSSAGKMSVQQTNQGGWNIEIDSPDLVLTQAVNNNKLALSSQLADNGFWQLVGKLARIRLEINNHQINGEIDLR
ncbi:MAG: hypothetical protein M1607_04220 [Patescibacteria group bacterium]|nr:hypothetical protein [Patescibacteria group bacterium]